MPVPRDKLFECMCFYVLQRDTSRIKTKKNETLERKKKKMFYTFYKRKRKMREEKHMDEKKAFRLWCMCALRSAGKFRPLAALSLFVCRIAG